MIVPKLADGITTQPERVARLGVPRFGAGGLCIALRLFAGGFTFHQKNMKR